MPFSFVTEDQKAEFRTVARKLWHRVAVKTIAKMDKDGDGKASWEEFMVIGTIEEAKAAFKEIDINKDGFADQDEVTTILTESFL